MFLLDVVLAVSVAADSAAVQRQEEEKSPVRYAATQFRRIKTVWPSGLRRWLQAPVRKGVGSNPTAVKQGEVLLVHLR